MKGAKVTGEVRWGILGAAHIASRQFLPGLREAGGGRAALVASRDYARADTFANLHGVERAAEGYDAVVDSPAIDAVYVALPNSHHSRWTQRALETGKAVLCEKPLCVGSAQTAAVLETAATTGALLWESFVFPFQHQHLRLLALVKSGAIGEVRELDSTFSYNLGRSEDIRLSEELGGGALADVGCYPIRLAQEVLSTRDPAAGDVVGFATGNGAVDTEAIAIVDYGRQRLVLGCGFGRAFDTFTRVLGSDGQIHLTNPFHPAPSDTLVLLRDGKEIVEHPTVDARSFSAALRHIHAVLREEEPPAHLAAESSLRTARTLEAVALACSRSAPPAPRFVPGDFEGRCNQVTGEHGVRWPSSLRCCGALQIPGRDPRPGEGSRAQSPRWHCLRRAWLVGQRRDAWSLRHRRNRPVGLARAQPAHEIRLARRLSRVPRDRTQPVRSHTRGRCERLRASGAVVIAITNGDASDLAAVSDLALRPTPGAELAVPATKTVTAEMALVLLLAAALGNGLAGAADLTTLPPAVATVLADDGPPTALAQAWTGYERLLVTASCPAYTGASSSNACRVLGAPVATSAPHGDSTWSMPGGLSKVLHTMWPPCEVSNWRVTYRWHAVPIRITRTASPR